MGARLHADTSQPDQLARSCIQRLGLRPPIDAAAVARACGVPVLPLPAGGPAADALLVYHPAGSSWAVFVGPQSKPFAIAHELGHYLLHRRQIRAGQPLDDPRYEQEADEFASELLASRQGRLGDACAPDPSGQPT